MPPRPVIASRTCAVATGLASLLLLAGGCGRPPAPAVEPPSSSAARPAGLHVPPLPDGSPAELLAFVEALRTPAVEPATNEEWRRYVDAVCLRGIEAADRIRGLVPPADDSYSAASRLKLESLMIRADLTSERTPESEAADAAVAAYADALTREPSRDLAALGRRIQVTRSVQRAFAADAWSEMPDLVARTAALIKADPGDSRAVDFATKFAESLEMRGPDARPAAIAANETFGRLLEASDEPERRARGAAMLKALRLLALPGRPMRLEGPLLDGKAFDPAVLAGKVVLVDFWATWCQPCLAELPTIQALYEKYHERGFEVLGVSLDESRQDVEGFMTERRIPWPTVFSGMGWQDPLADSYGIRMIPRLILIGRDGAVISIDAKGERLADAVAELFPN